MSNPAKTDDTQTINGVTVTDIDKAVDLAMDARIIDEEYKMWKKNTPFLYDVIINHVLEQTSLTCQWFPEKTEVPGKDYSVQRLLLGTQSLNDEANYVTIAEVRLPTAGNKVNTVGSYGAGAGKIEVVQKIVHQDHVHRARYMPQNPNLIATKSPSPDVHIFDRTKHSSKPARDDVPSPDLVLEGHSKGGYAVAWSDVRAGYVASGSEDGSVLVWDVEAKADGAGKPPTLKPLLTLSGHNNVVEDVAWHPLQEHTLASVSDDKHLIIWDTRSSEAVHKVQVHDAEVNALSFNLHDENVLATGSSDKTAAMWDLRNLKEKMHSFAGHTAEVFSVQWAPFGSNVLATAGSDRRVCFWDVSRIGEEQSEEDAEDGPPELMFSHAGHTEKVNDIAWNANEEWVMASCADDEVLQVWQIAAALREDEEEEYDESDDLE